MKQPLEYWDRLREERPQDLADVMAVINAQQEADTDGNIIWYGR